MCKLIEVTVSSSLGEGGGQGSIEARQATQELYTSEPGGCCVPNSDCPKLMPPEQVLVTVKLPSDCSNLQRDYIHTTTNQIFRQVYTTTTNFSAPGCHQHTQLLEGSVGEAVGWLP